MEWLLPLWKVAALTAGQIRETAGWQESLFVAIVVVIMITIIFMAPRFDWVWNMKEFKRGIGWRILYSFAKMILLLQNMAIPCQLSQIKFQHFFLQIHQSVKMVVWGEGWLELGS